MVESGGVENTSWVVSLLAVVVRCGASPRRGVANARRRRGSPSTWRDNTSIRSYYLIMTFPVDRQASQASTEQVFAPSESADKPLARLAVVVMASSAFV